MKFIVLSLALAVSVLSCKNKIESEYGDQNMQVKSVIMDKNQANANQGFLDGSEIGFYMYEVAAGHRIPYRDNVTGIVELGGGVLFNPAIPYPSENALDIYAYYPYTDVKAESGAIKLNTVVDQSVDGGMGAMDFLAARVLNKARPKKGEEKFDLIFSHKYSKVAFILKQGVGLNSVDQLLDAKVVIKQVPAKSQYVYVTNTMESDFTSLVDVLPFGEFVKNTAGDGVEGVSVILPPRAAVDGEYVIELVVNGVTYKSLVVDALESGKVHNYTLTVNRTGVVPDVDIANWEDGTAGSGSAVLWASSKFKFTLENGVDKEIGAKAIFVMADVSGSNVRKSNVVKGSDDVFDIVTPVEKAYVISAIFEDAKNGGTFVVNFPANTKINPIQQDILILSSWIQ